MSKFTAIPNLSVNFKVMEDNGKLSNMELHEGMILKDITFKSNGQTVTKTGKLTEFLVSTKASSVDTAICPCRQESAFENVVTVVGFVLDASDEFGADVYLVKPADIKSIGEIMVSEVTIDITNMEPDALAKAIEALEPGHEIVLNEGIIKEELVITKDATVKGNQVGVSAANGYRCQDVVEGETIISAPMTVAAGEVEFDGITLSGTAIPKLGKVDANEEVVIRLKNCRITDLGDGSEAAQTINAFMAAGNNTNTKVRFEIENCYFGNNGGRMYNLFNMHGKWMSGSYIKNCYFANDCCKNTITIYDAEEGAVIDITGNVWENSQNGVRLLTRGDCNIELNLKNNTWHDTEMPDANGINYGGLFMIQTNMPHTITQKNIVVNMSGNKNMSQNPQELYYWGDETTNGKHRPMPVEDRPRIYKDGALISYEGIEVIEYDPVEEPEVINSEVPVTE